MNARAEIVKFLYDVIGEEGCGVSCSEAEGFRDERGWNMMLEGFYGAWFIGKQWKRLKPASRNTLPWASV